MARRVPCCAVWDDHDFRKNNGESTNYPALVDSLEGFLSYWGNDPIRPDLGLTTLLSYGNVDIYLLDARIRRNRGDHACSPNGERVWSAGSADFTPLFQPVKGRRGFATLEVDTTSSRLANWRITVSYYDERESATVPYESRSYVLRDRQFQPE